MRKVIVFIVVLFLSGVNQSATAQDLILTSGNSASGATGMVDFSIGMVFYQQEEGTGGSVYSGTQQPFEISNVTVVESIAKSTNYLVFPNPARSTVSLQIDGDISEMRFAVFDLSGREMMSDIVLSNNTTVDLSSLADNVYIMKLFRKNSWAGSVRIIKQ